MANKELRCGSFSRLLFSFSLGSEVLFGLVFGALVQKRDFCSVGTGSLVDPFLPFLYCFCLIHCEGEQKQVVKYRVKCCTMTAYVACTQTHRHTHKSWHLVCLCHLDFTFTNMI